ncbi:unnamed protein product, partial [Mesorhabditis belari]|uniref:Protein kinase domain-containing protein n=1 Tax=Mesorhabditis belari TaxID=2138241 RepID=A0AAF3ENQ3_9BILA
MSEQGELSEEISEEFLYENEWLKEENLLGCGAYGAVYQVPNWNPPLAVKMFTGDLKRMRKLIRNELSTLQHLKHKLVVKYLGFISRDCGARKEIIGIVMQMVERKSLADIIFNPKFTYSVYTVAVWMEQLFLVLDYLDHEGKMHRDIKPENILVDQFFYLILGDFGMAKAKASVSGSFVGTERYTCPEILFSEKTSKEENSKADVYSMGIVCWEIIERRRILNQYKRYYGFERTAFANDFKKGGNLVEIEELTARKHFRDHIYFCTQLLPKSRYDSAKALESATRIKRFLELDMEFEFIPELNEHQTTILPPKGIVAKHEPFVVKKTDEDNLCNFDSISISVQEKDLGKLAEGDDKSDEEESSLENEKLEATDDVLASEVSTDISSLENNGQVTSNETEDQPIEDPENLPKNENMYTYEWQISLPFGNVDAKFVEKTKEGEIIKETSLTNFSTPKSIGITKKFDEGPVWDKRMILSDAQSYLKRILAKEAAAYVSIYKQIELWEAFGEFHQSFLEFQHLDFDSFEATKANNAFLPKLSCFTTNLGGEFLLFDTTRTSNDLYTFVPRNDLGNPKAIVGQWIDEMHFVVREGEPMANGIEWFRFESFEETITRGHMFEAMQRLWGLATKLKETISKSDGQDLPVKGYVFQLRYPPMDTCNCEIKCPLQFSDKKRFKRLKRFNVPCNQPYQDYTALYFEFCLFLARVQRLDTVNDLILVISRFIWLKYFVNVGSCSCPKYFLFCQFKAPEKQNLLVLECIGTMRALKNELLRIPCMDEHLSIHPIYNIEQEEIDFVNLRRIDLKDYLTEELLEKIVNKFLAKYLESDEICEFLTVLEVEKNDFLIAVPGIREIISMAYNYDFSHDATDELKNEIIEENRFMDRLGSALLKQFIAKVIKDDDPLIKSKTDSLHEMLRLQQKLEYLFAQENIIV